MKFTQLLCSLLVISLIFSCKEKTLFTALDASETGITFNNQIDDNDSLNILSYQYIYNGGGVGLGDFNADGLQDIFFSGNQVDNKLYLNKGEMKFEEITKTAGVEGKNRWCSGVSVVDINTDGKLDVYVSSTLEKKAENRANLLYVNQGNDKNGTPIFKEMAQDYGIADTTYTTHAAFFDYDNDGDLDLYVLVDQIFDDRITTNFHEKIVDGSAATNDRLYRNDFDKTKGHPVFTDVSKKAGILMEGFGLGVNITDINRDGWKDIFVTNDFISNDLLYINNHDGTFTNRAKDYFKHTSYSAMGNDVNDINNDGLMDIIAVDMLPEDNIRKKNLMSPNNYYTYQENIKMGYEFQFVRNTLQLNQGIKPNTTQPIFSEISMLAGVSETDWSWAPMVVDFDHDGFRDLIITNGFPKDITDHDFGSYNAEYGSFSSQKDILANIPIIKIPNYAFRNKGDLTFENVTEQWGITKPSFSNGAAYGDLDNDGDLDYVVNNINDIASVYKNNLVETKKEEANYLKIRFKGANQNPMAQGTWVEISYDNGKKQAYENTIYRGYLSSVENSAHFGLGKIQSVDEVKITWQDGKQQIIKNVKANQILEVDYQKAQSVGEKAVENIPTILTDITENSGINFTHKEFDFIDFNNQKTLLHKFSQMGPSLAVGDVNGDGLEDIFVGGSAQDAQDKNPQTAQIFLQTSAGKFSTKPFLANSSDVALMTDDAGSLLFDADSDGDLDLYIVSGGVKSTGQLSANQQDRIFANDGKGNFTEIKNALPAFKKAGSCVRASDFDHDGDLDLFVGGRVEPTKYPMAVSSYLLRNDSPLTPEGGKKDLAKSSMSLKVVGKESVSQTPPSGVGGLLFSLQPFPKIGLICDALWTDYDNDGWQDLLLAGEWMPLTLLKNEKGTFKNTTPKVLAEATGFWNSLVGGDFDNDGDTDYLAGNIGTNTLVRASEEFPVQIYAKDFDGNGFYDAFPTVYFKDEKGKKQEFAFFGRDDMGKQMITLKKRFIYYNDFAKTPFSKMLTDEEKQDMLTLKATNCSSVYVENLGNGDFKISTLPVQAQFAPIGGMVTGDFNDDDFLDVVLVGNDYGNELQVGRMDALNGLLLLGDGKGGFSPQVAQKSGFYVPFNAKSLVKLSGGLVVASQNRADLRVFSSPKAEQYFTVKPKDISVKIQLKNGKIRKEECYYGSSYLSQSSRSIAIPKGGKVLN
jgi:enediyne biosynthesis protein E4